MIVFVKNERAAGRTAGGGKAGRAGIGDELGPCSLVLVRLRRTAVTADPPAAALAADGYDMDAAFMQFLRHGWGIHVV